MELPIQLASLYKHWQKHTHLPEGQSNVKVSQKELKKVEAFAIERMKVWERKQTNESVLTEDLILQEYRFCNIYRELDKQTILMHQKLLHLTGKPDLWFLNALFYRFIARPETIDSVGLLSFDKKHNERVMKKLISHKKPKYGVPYIFPISIIQRSSWPTRESFFCLYLPTIAKKCAKYLLSGNSRSVVEIVDSLVKIIDFNFKFHLTEVVIDFAYQYPETIDLFKQFPVGPGSLPTMHLLSPEKDPKEVCLLLIKHDIKDFPYLTLKGKPIRLSAENWEGIGCEYRKYSNLQNGKGRKRHYR